MTEHDMELTTPPEIPDDDPPTCGKCRQFIDEVDEYGVCALEVDVMPNWHLSSMYCAMDWLDEHRRHDDCRGCLRWEEDL